MYCAETLLLAFKGTLTPGQLFCTVPKHEYISSPDPRCPELTLAQPQLRSGVATSFTCVITSQHDTRIALFSSQSVLLEHNGDQRRDYDCHFTNHASVESLCSWTPLLNDCREKWSHGPSVISSIALPCLCISHCTVLQYTSSNCAGIRKRTCTWGWYRVLTLVEHTGLWGSNMLGHSPHHLAWVRPEPNTRHPCSVTCC